MNNLLASLIGLILIFPLVFTQCNIQVVTTPRPNTYIANGLSNKIYDITITNIGSCSTQEFYLQLTPENNQDIIINTWNLFQQDSTHFFSDIDYSFQPGQSITAGFIVSYNSQISQGVVVSSVVAVQCEDSGACLNQNIAGTIPYCSELSCSTSQICIEDGGLGRCITIQEPTTSASSSGSTTSSTTGSTSTGSTTSSSNLHRCQASVSLVARLNGEWTDINQNNNQIYDINLQNTGACTLSALRFEITTQGEDLSITQQWNLSEDFSLINFGKIESGSQYNSAGFVLTGDGTATIQIITKGCNCNL